MWFRRLTASALFLAGLFAVAVAAEPPAGSPDQPGTGSGTAKKGDGDKKKADPTDATVAAALANDPDVKVARAKVQLAEAELAKLLHDRAALKLRT